ncbi:peptidase U35, phage prohead HK97 [Staphylococcus pseudintermedius]|uniref:hypothetical protein n=1 Tax=Staphylococcus pseudintermedius TaxID=283734 RepID=UPI0010DF664D|nr:hypothetical protein [Staphylococcus pseudintermedius]VTS31534.1 peptidase U35, phage prohead HK97 [Staphylococcus pseudintermedius]
MNYPAYAEASVEARQQIQEAELKYQARQQALIGLNKLQSKEIKIKCLIQYKKHLIIIAMHLLKILKHRAGEIRGTIENDPEADVTKLNIEIEGLNQAKENIKEKEQETSGKSFIQSYYRTAV